jgi:hypothetical protein
VFAIDAISNAPMAQQSGDGNNSDGRNLDVAGSGPDGHLNRLQGRNARTTRLFRRKSLGFLELFLTWAAHWLGRSSRKPPFTTLRLRI